jgi:hypothetical protein
MISKQPAFNIYFFFAGSIGISFLAWFFHTIPPKAGSVIFLGICLMCAILFCFLYAITNNVRRSLLWSIGGGVFFILRAAKLHDPLYIVLLIALLASLEMALKNK